jgi:STAS-like domain of unknown function (DUF4325)
MIEFSSQSDTISFHDMRHESVVGTFIQTIKKGIAQGCRHFHLDFSMIKSIYPNTGVPICGITDYFTNVYLEDKITFTHSDNHKIDKTHIFNPLRVSENIEILSQEVLNKVWRFADFTEVSLLVNSFVNQLRQTEQFEVGVLDGLTWSLNEVMDNVLQHSNAPYGYVMGQIHRHSKHIAFCIYDSGQGIYNSLQKTFPQLQNAEEALTIAVKEGITRDKKIGQGNGMYGLHQIVKFNEGRLSITSNAAQYTLSSNGVVTKSGIPTVSLANGGTIVDFQLEYRNKVSISEALNFGNKPYTGFVNYYLEDLEDTEGSHLHQLKDWKGGVGTRLSGKMLFNEILNNYRETQRRIIIDFADLRVISSSFADELIGKLVVEFGFFNFNNLVRLKNMNELIQGIVQRSVAQRMAESIENKG